MSVNEGTRLERKEKCISLMGDEKSLAKVGAAKREKRATPHFELHTKSSLLKRKEPKQYPMVSLKKFQNPEGGRICKRRSGIVKQSRSMQALRAVLMREKDPLQVLDSLPSKVTKTVLSSEKIVKKSTVLPRSDSIESVLCDVGRWMERLTRLEIEPRDETTQETIRESHVGDSHTCPQDDRPSEHSRDAQRSVAIALMSMSLQDSETRNAFSFIEDHPYVECRRRSQPGDDETERCKIELPYRVSAARGRPEDAPSDGERSINPFKSKMPVGIANSGTFNPVRLERVDAEVCQHIVSSNVTQRKRNARTTIGRVAIQSGNVTDQRDFNLGDSESAKFTKPVEDTQSVANNFTTSSRKRRFYRRNYVSSNPPAWKPAGVKKTPAVQESAASLTQNSSRSSMVKSAASTKNQQWSKRSTIEHTEPLDNSKFMNVPVSRRRSKVSMKENRDPRADHTKCASKIGEHFRDIEEEIEDTRRAKNLPGPRSGSRSRSKSRSRRWQSATRRNPPRGQRDIDDEARVEAAPVYKKRSRSSKVMSTLKKIIDSSVNGEDAAKNVAGVPSERERKSWKSTSIVGTQTSPRNNRHLVEAGCNTMPYQAFCADAGVSCDLIDLTSLKLDDTESRSTIIQVNLEDASIHTIVAPRLVEHDKSDVESDCLIVTEGLLISEHEKTLMADADSDAESEGYSVNTTKIESAETLNEATDGNCESSATTIAGGEKEILGAKSPGDLDVSTRIAGDEHEESTTSCVSEHRAIDTWPRSSRWTSLSLYDYDASCSDSSEEPTERPTDDAPDSIPGDVLVAFQLAAEYARNLQRAVALYNESLMSGEVGEVRGTSTHDEGRFHESASFLSCRADANFEDGSSSSFVCSSSSGESVRAGHQLELRDRGAGREEEDVTRRGEKTSSTMLVPKHRDLQLMDVRSLARLLLRRTREEECALELLKMEGLARDERPRASPPPGLVPIALRGHLVPFVYCLLCTLIFWYFQASFICRSDEP
ncbi:PREDICTED: uncharacterized protein LOC106744632 [Dinoponera quadriceps]|uniref:Uncharacterized protein LOC106744632 n=1 Tax=Dinoponera quadriceps TaxID=609295 RepID=A0A6P3X9R4_DINQU|nr:PREDICTED: uncharacterized protein LOC106744632 [Dinoponera quadriceps]